MPGHVKKGGKQEADPDPSPWLIVSNEMRNNRSIITIIIITRPCAADLPGDQTNVSEKVIIFVTHGETQLTFLRK